MESMPLEIVRDHLIIPFRGASAVLDTGSPFTLPAPAIVGAHLGRPIRWLVGTDRLGARPFLVDWPGRSVTFGAPAPEAGDRMSLEDSLGVPLIPLGTPTGPALAFLDTGAPISYAPPSAVAGRRPVGRRADFHPMIGEFETGIYTLPVTAGARQLELTVGVLPPLLRRLLALLGPAPWILGSDYFRDRRIFLDLAQGTLIDLTAVPGAELVATRPTTPAAAPR